MLGRDLSCQIAQNQRTTLQQYQHYKDSKFVSKYPPVVLKKQLCYNYQMWHVAKLTKSNTPTLSSPYTQPHAKTFVGIYM